MASTRHGIALMVASQAQKEVTFNEAIILLAVLTQTIVKEVGRDTPPASPADWDIYIVGAAPTGAWTGHTDELALYDGAGWLFYPPAEGWRVWDLGTSSHWTYTTGWVQSVFAGFGDGSAGAPSIFFAADPDTGIFRSGGNKLSIAQGGSEAAVFGASDLKLYRQIEIDMNTGGDWAGKITNASATGLGLIIEAKGATLFRIVDTGAAATIVEVTAAHVVVNKPLKLARYSVASLPAAASHDGCMVYLTDEAGGGVPAWSDGTAWRRMSDGAVVS
jgi:hypothetical protein